MVIHLLTSGIVGGLVVAVAAFVVVGACCLVGAALGRIGLALEARRPPLTREQLDQGGRFRNGHELGE